MSSAPLGVLVALVAFVTFAGHTFAQPHPPGPPPEMKKLDFLVGRWEGTGKMTMGPQGEQEARVVEKVEPRLDGAILMIEGIGRIGTPGGADGRVVHHALGVINYDAAAKEFRMRAFLRDGRSVDPRLIVEDKRIIWSFADPRAGEIRYTITLDDQGRWHEIGERSGDGGKTFMKFFEMTLERKGDASAT